VHREDQMKLIEQLYREMYHMLLIYAKSALSDVSLAEEAVQETFRIACTKVSDIEESPNPKGWLLNALKNVLRNMRRQQVQITKLTMAAIMSETAVVYDGVESALDDMYANMVPREDFLLLKQIALRKTTMLELSRELGISVEACKKRVQRAKSKMKAALEKEL